MKKCFIILLSSLVACSTLTSCNLTGVIIAISRKISEERYNNEKPKHSPHFAERRAAAIKQSKIDTVTRDEVNALLNGGRK